MPRPFGNTFKQHYELDRAQTVHEFEQKMLHGMRIERVEVLVVAFCKGGVVVCTRASIGYENRTRKVSIEEWCNLVLKFKCDEVRHYHNHPGLFACLSPSYQDSKTHRLVRIALEPSGVKMRSFVAKFCLFGGWKIREYSDIEWQSLLDARNIGRTTQGHS